jgi:hypothetical protein
VILRVLHVLNLPFYIEHNTSQQPKKEERAGDFSSQNLTGF